jgi:hypothetical protein
MARMRTLKPSFFTNELLAELPLTGRLLFQGLWCWADRLGRLEDRPLRIKAHILPFDDADADALLNDLAERGFIVRYVVDGQRYIQVVNFSKHQTPHVKEAASTLPGPDEHSASTGLTPEEHSASTFLLLDPGLLELDPGTVPHGTDAPARDTPAREEPAKPPKYTPAFETFWRSYPRPNGRAWDKPATYAAWRRLRPDGEMADAICAGVAAWRLGRDWQREFIKAPAKFLDGRLWEEPPEPWDMVADLARASPNGVHGKPSKMDNVRAGFALGGKDDGSIAPTGHGAPVRTVAEPSRITGGGGGPPVDLPPDVWRIE